PFNHDPSVTVQTSKASLLILFTFPHYYSNFSSLFILYSKPRILDRSIHVLPKKIHPTPLQSILRLLLIYMFFPVAEFQYCRGLVRRLFFDCFRIPSLTTTMIT
ncbi:hypothetical protein KSS87_018253, partial [Heliosperma pusillum]